MDEDGEPDEASEAYQSWLAAYEELLHAADPDPPGFPSHKLAFNECFALTPPEIEAVLARASPVPVTDGFQEGFDDFWAKWLSYLRTAAREGGARVT